MAITREVIISDENFEAYVEANEKITLTRYDNKEYQIDLGKEFVEAIIKEWNNKLAGVR